MGSPNFDDRSEIAFFDVETTFPTGSEQSRAILEFGAILVCPRKLKELWSYSTLVRPANPSLINSLSHRRNGINPDSVASAPSFSEIADTVYRILHGRIWAGHNIRRFDCERIKEAFCEIGRDPPEPKGLIDSLTLLTQKFGKRAGDMKMASLATYFGLGEQEHRSLPDLRLNLEVVKLCGTILFLESSFPDIFTEIRFLDPGEVHISSINVCHDPFFGGDQKMKLLHKDVNLQLYCPDLRIHFGLRPKYNDSAGRPRLSFVVDASPSLCRVLDACDDIAKKSFVDSGNSSEWMHVVIRSYANIPTVRLNIPTTGTEETAQYATEMYQKDSSSGTTQKLVFSNFDVKELGSLLNQGSFVDAYLSLDLFDYKQTAGIRLVAKKLVIHDKIQHQ